MKIKINNMFKKFLATILLLFTLVPVVQAQETVNIYFFWREGCPHCADEKPFLQSMEEKYDFVELHTFELPFKKNTEELQDNLKLLQKVGEELNVSIAGIPFTVVGEHHFIGWQNAETTGKEIEAAITCEDACTDKISKLISPSQPICADKDTCGIDIDQSQTMATGTLSEYKINIPLLGEVDAKDFSLPVLTIVLGFLDGFNPCAMWVLLFLISALLGMKDKKRMWILGGTFIATSAIIYYAFMAAWLNVFLIIGFVFWIRLLVGILAIGGGSWTLKGWWDTKDKADGCTAVDEKERTQMFDKIQHAIQENSLVLGMISMAGIAVAVNMIELVCSAGLPAVYTQVLTLNNLPTWQYYLYIFLYIIIFMIDDIFVFVMAMTTLELTGVTTKYTKTAHFIGGCIMVIIGILLLFRPELLMLG